MMGAPDAQGIFIYDDTEDWSPQDEYQNLLADSVSATIADVRAEIAAIDSLVDSNWVNVTTLGTGVTIPTPASNYQPRVRKVGNRVDLAGAVVVGAGWSAAHLVTIPLGYRLTGTYVSQFISPIVTSGGKSAMLFLDAANSRIQVPTGYVSAAIPNGELIPLVGSWYIN